MFKYVTLMALLLQSKDVRWRLQLVYPSSDGKSCLPSSIRLHGVLNSLKKSTALALSIQSAAPLSEIVWFSRLRPWLQSERHAGSSPNSSRYFLSVPFALHNT